MKRNRRVNPCQPTSQLCDLFISIIESRHDQGRHFHMTTADRCRNRFFDRFQTAAADVLIKPRRKRFQVDIHRIHQRQQFCQRLGVDKTTFYDESRIAIMPMGLCYPGRGKSGDLPPRPECAPTWHDKVLMLLPNIELTLLIGQYAQRHYLREAGKDSLTETVRNWADYGPAWLPLPHPSPRNTFWLKKNPWFEQEVIPHLQQRVAPLLL